MVEGVEFAAHLQKIRLHVARMAEAFGGPLSAVTHDQIELYLRGRKHKGRYFNNARSEIVTFLRWCRKRNYLPDKETEAEKVEKEWEVEEAATIFAPEEFERIMGEVRVDLVLFTWPFAPLEDCAPRKS